MAYGKKFNISIIGCGFLGGAISSGFSNYSDIKIYDKFKYGYDSLEDTVRHGEFIFFCLPTPYYIDDDGKQDISILENAVRDVHNLVEENSNKIAIIKSTVLPGTNQEFQIKYPKLKFVSNPEFLSAASARIDWVCMSRNILGGEKSSVERVHELYRHRFGNSVLTFKTDWESAELSKYASNMFFAVKLSFFNYIYSMCEKMGLSYDQIRDMMISDSRMGRSHDKVPGENGKCGWGNFCFPKDMLALINYSKDLGLDPKLLNASWEQNLDDRGEKDWEKLSGVVSYRNKK
jgi:UDPglucose 6-dehydrogenase